MMEVDSLKNHAHGWLMWQIKVTTEKKYLAADHTHQVLIYLQSLPMQSNVMALSSAHETMHDAEFI